MFTLSPKIIKDTRELQSKQIEDDIPLPSGTCLTTVAGIQLPHEDVGHALQFFEFCAAFSEVHADPSLVIMNKMWHSSCLCHCLEYHGC